MKRFFNSLFKNYIAVGRLIIPNKSAIIAITNSMCMMPVREYTNTPNAHPMSKITAMIYSSEFMIIFYLMIFIDIITTLHFGGMF